MRDFFKGWRRKAGLVTLVMALILEGAWMRSLYGTDLLTCGASGTTTRVIVKNGFVAWCIKFRDPPERFELSKWTWQRRPNRGHAGLHPITDEISEWTDFDVGGRFFRQYLRFGIVFDEFRNDNHALHKICVVPCWPIALPLTLLSIYLLVSKPRSATPMKRTEPPSAEAP